MRDQARSHSLPDWSHPLPWLEPSPSHWWSQTQNSRGDSSAGSLQSSSFNHLFTAHCAQREGTANAECHMGTSSTALRSVSLTQKLSVPTYRVTPAWNLGTIFASFLPSYPSTCLTDYQVFWWPFLEKFFIYAFSIISVVTTLVEALLILCLDYESSFLTGSLCFQSHCSQIHPADYPRSIFLQIFIY